MSNETSGVVEIVETVEIEEIVDIVETEPGVVIEPDLKSERVQDE
jgi:hypothetical protein